MQTSFAVKINLEAMTWILKPFWGEQALGRGSIWSIDWMCHTDLSSDLWSDSPRTSPQPENRPSYHRILLTCVVSPTSVWRVLNNKLLLLLEKLSSDMEGAPCPQVVNLRCCRCFEGARWVCQPSWSPLPMVVFTSPLLGQGRVMHSAEM